MKKEYPAYTEAEAFIISMLEENLSSSLIYHNKEHTLDVLEAALRISEAEGISAEDIKLLRIAVLIHDAGFIHVYKNHEERGCEMAREYLPAFHFTEEQISLICGMIMSTKVPQDPKTRLDQIIADADLDYLGRDDVYLHAQRLFDEMKLYDLLPDEMQWIPFQIDFLKKHHYFTDYSRKIREPNKNLYLRDIAKKLPP